MSSISTRQFLGVFFLLTSFVLLKLFYKLFVVSGLYFQGSVVVVTSMALLIVSIYLLGNEANVDGTTDEKKEKFY